MANHPDSKPFEPEPSPDIKLSPWQKDDYISSDNPFREVAAYADNSFREEQAITIADSNAKKVGVKNFRSLYRKFRKSQTSKSPVPQIITAANFTKATGQPLQLTCGDWYCDDSGVWVTSGKLIIVACPFPVLLTARMQNVETGIEKVEISYRPGNSWRTLIVPFSVIAKPQSLVDLADYGLGINSKMASHLSDYLIQMYGSNYGNLPYRQCVGHLGWVSPKIFAPYTQSLQCDASADYTSLYDAVSSCGDGMTWVREIVRVRQHSIAAHIVIAASFASVLVEPLGLLPFFCHLWAGVSGTGKTVAIMCAASVWADPTIGKYIRTFDSTSVGLEKTAAFLNSLPICIDELQLARDSQGRSTFDVYKLAQGVGRTCGNKAGGVDAVPRWANTIISTGETPITSQSSGAGAINRVLQIECPAGESVIADGHHTAQLVRENFGFGGKCFVKHLLTADTMCQVRATYDAYHRVLSTGSITDKQVAAAALVLTADHFATEWIFKDGNALIPEDIMRYCATSQDVSIGVRAYQYLCDWVAISVNHFYLEGPPINVGDVYGHISGGYAYIIATVFDNALTDAGYDPAPVRSYLSQNHLLRQSMGQNSGYAISHKIGGVNRRCIALLLPVDNNCPQDDCSI